VVIGRKIYARAVATASETTMASPSGAACSADEDVPQERQLEDAEQAAVEHGAR
jgi:hypothetical protein